MGLKELFLNKGWAGRTLSREATAERLNVILKRHHELNHSYDHAIRTIDDREAAETMNRMQKTARVDVAKLSETVLSAGKPSYNGIDLESRDLDLGTGDREILDRLKSRESEFEQLLVDELELEHQIRTRAVLSIVLENSRARLEFMRSLGRRSRQSSGAATS